MVALRGGIGLEVTEAGGGVADLEWQNINASTMRHNRKALTFQVKEVLSAPECTFCCFARGG